jgi:hypothetical protein
MGAGAVWRGKDEHNVNNDSVDTASDNIDPESRPLDLQVQYWLNEINAARKREDDYRKNGQTVLDIYSGKKVKTTPFNILFSNTETMFPVLYSNIPRPVVKRRFKDDDPLGKAAAHAGERMLEYLVDTNVDGYDTFDEAMKQVTLGGLLPGRGVATVKYDAEEGIYPPVEGQTEGTPYKKGELVCPDAKVWDRVYFGHARKWSDVPWIAYEEHIDKTEAVRLFGKDVADKITFTAGLDDEDDDKRDKSDADKNSGERKTALIYQIWDKADGRKVRYVCSQYKDGYLKVDDDPLQLTGFFNCPRPLQFVEKLNDITPVGLYELYKNQATELNRITQRLNKVVEAIKAKAIYDTELGEDIKRLLEADDNAFVPADKSSSLAAEKGLQNAIWFMPLEALVNVAEKLILAREQCKMVIYEIMGIADILRGQSKASETLGAQKIKETWGGLRLKPKQKEVQRYARDMLRLMLEVAASKFSEKTWAQMTGLPFVTTDRRQQLEKVAQQVRMASQQMAAANQQPTPQQQQQVAQLQAELQKPVWGAVLELLRNDMQRAYRIDIETNSTVEPEAVEDQKNIAEVMTALGQFLNGITPLVISGAMPFQAAQSMMLAITRRFRFGDEIEDYIKAMQPPKPPDDGKEQKAQQQMLESKQQQMQKDAQFSQEKTQGVTEIQRLKLELEMERISRAADKREADLALRELKIDVAEDRLKIAEQVAVERVQSKDSVSSMKQSTNDKVRSIQDASNKKQMDLEKKAAQDSMATVAEATRAMQGIIDAMTKLQENIEEVNGRIEAISAREVVRAEKIKGGDGRLAAVRRHHQDGSISEVAVS